MPPLPRDARRIALDAHAGLFRDDAALEAFAQAVRAATEGGSPALLTRGEFVLAELGPPPAAAPPAAAPHLNPAAALAPGSESRLRDLVGFAALSLETRATATIGLGAQTLGDLAAHRVADLKGRQVPDATIAELAAFLRGYGLAFAADAT